MAWAFLVVGLILLVAAFKGKHKELWKQVQEDFTGPDNFFYWILAIVLIVALGNIRAIRPITDAFLGLVILVIVLAQYRNGRDLFSEFISQVRNGTQ